MNRDKSSMLSMKTYLYTILMSCVIGFGPMAFGQSTSSLLKSEAAGGIKDLMDELSEREKQLDAAEKENAKLKEANRKLQEQLDQKTAELKSVTRSDALEAALKGKKKALAQRDVALKARDKALSQRDEAQKKYDELTLSSAEQIRDLKDKLDAARESLVKAERLISERDVRIAELQKQLTSGDESLNDEKFALYYNLGCIYKAAKQYEKAEGEFLKALKVNPDDSNTHYNLGILYDDNLKKPRKAREHYERFLQLAPNDESAADVKMWLKELQD